MKDAANIGQDKSIQDPADAIRQQTGTYSDAVERLSEADKLPINSMPKGPDPMPFQNVRKSTGGR